MGENSVLALLFCTLSLEYVNGQRANLCPETWRWLWRWTEMTAAMREAERRASCSPSHFYPPCFVLWPFDLLSSSFLLLPHHLFPRLSTLSLPSLPTPSSIPAEHLKGRGENTAIGFHLFQRHARLQPPWQGRAPEGGLPRAAPLTTGSWHPLGGLASALGNGPARRRSGRRFSSAGATPAPRRGVENRPWGERGGAPLRAPGGVCRLAAAGAGGAGPGRSGPVWSGRVRPARGYVTAGDRGRRALGGSSSLFSPPPPPPSLHTHTPAPGRRGCGAERAGAGSGSERGGGGRVGCCCCCCRLLRRATREGEEGGRRRRRRRSGGCGRRRVLCASRRASAAGWLGGWVRSPAAGLHNGSRSVGWILPWLLFCGSTHPPSSQVPGYGFLSGDLPAAFCRCLWWGFGLGWDFATLLFVWLRAGTKKTKKKGISFILRSTLLVIIRCWSRGE